MKLADIEGNDREAQPGLVGKCRLYGHVMVAKCGKHRVWHWAHQKSRDCDPWWEPETEWHRGWKNKFPAECQEVVQHDEQSGEKHIADVRTPHGLVIEFQRSPLNPLERTARERFHGNMVWVVDGTRLKRDYPRFNSRRDDLKPTPLGGCFLFTFPDEGFPAMWLDSSVPVIFDFRGMDESQPPDAFRDALWCLLPGRAQGSAVVVGMSREQFVEVAQSRPQLLPFKEILELCTELRAAEAPEPRPFAEILGGRGPRRQYKRF